ncbi:MAG: hypothetical protein GX817_06580 [Elusimicrobia bacterium]|nr:hypothetical protein [Elusimicrobiota bacterium]
MKSFLFSRSLWIYHYPAADCGGCKMEIETINRVFHDAMLPAPELVKNIRRADLLLITGMVNFSHVSQIKLLYSQAPRPIYVIAAGVCALDGGIFRESYSIAPPLERHIPVDIYIPGCPPRPEAIMDGVSKLLSKIKISEKQKKAKKNTRNA